MSKYLSAIILILIITFTGFSFIAMAELNSTQFKQQSEKPVSKTPPCLEDYRNLKNRPKRIFVGVGSPIRPLSLSDYEKRWADQVEAAIKRNQTPDLKPRYGTAELNMTVEVGPLGQVGAIEIDKSSGFQKLDTGIAALIRDSAPFAPFPPGLCEQVDIIYFTGIFQFKSDGARLIRDLNALPMHQQGK